MSRYNYKNNQQKVTRSIMKITTLISPKYRSEIPKVVGMSKQI